MCESFYEQRIEYKIAHWDENNNSAVQLPIFDIFMCFGPFECQRTKYAYRIQLRWHDIH
jgi:hypothetical protein